MGKNKNNELNKNYNAPSKGDTEFAKENGLKKVALRAQKDQNK